jgi:hypothetical protein
MLIYDADPRDSIAAIGCQTCCCKSASMRPGETNMVAINYCYWTIPMGGKGISYNQEFSIDKVASVDPSIGSYPVIGLINPSTAINTTLNYNLTSGVTDVDGDTLTFSKVPMFDVNHGVLTLNANGTTVYVPETGYVGYDSYYFSVSDGHNKPIVGQAIIAVGGVSAASASMYDAPVAIGRSRVTIDQRLQQIRFPLQVSPIAMQGEIYRLQIRQEALDCDCNKLYHMSCVDIAIGKC